MKNRSLTNYLYLLTAGTTPKKWRPLLAVYYLTYHCSFRCPYCSDGEQTPYYRLKSAIVDPQAVVAILRTIRRYTDYLVLTGGEPLEYPDLDNVLRALPTLQYKGVVFTTNGYDLAPHLDLVLQSVQHLVFSVDTLDRQRADQWHGIGPGSFDRVLENIARANRSRDPKQCEIIISAVATPTNISDLYDVYQFCDSHGFRFAVCPELQGVKAHPLLQDNPAYRNFFDFLIAEKKKGASINGTPVYLAYLRDLKKFRCYPSATLAVAPDGSVFYPCLERGQHGGNLQETPDLDQLRRSAIAQLGPEPICDTRCHSACALSFGLILGRPWSAFSELGPAIRGKRRQKN